jgi:hypothetical protein
MGVYCAQAAGTRTHKSFLLPGRVAFFTKKKRFIMQGFSFLKERTKELLLILRVSD